MPVLADSAEFIDCVRKSGLLSARRLNGFLAAQQAEGADLQSAARVARAMLADGVLTKFQTIQLMLGRYRGFLIGKYRILEALGSGGMSHVFLCEHVRMGHRVALKLLPDELAKDSDAVERFFGEARAVAALNHPNIVRAHDVDQHGGRYYLVMDYVEGASLHQLVMRHGPFRPERAAACIAQTAVGLQHIFEAGLVHRDVKPGNLLVDTVGSIRILDLGLALFNEDAFGKSGTGRDGGVVLGTADFLAPEQAMRSDDVDIRADLYSLGATFYFLLTGKAPFEEQSAAQKLFSHQSKTPEPPPGPRKIVAVVQKLMAKDPADRYQTPAEVVEALRPLTDGVIDPPEQADLLQLSKAAGGAASSRRLYQATLLNPPSTRIDAAPSTSRRNSRI